MVGDGKHCCEEFDLHADICNVGLGFLATDYMSYLQSSGTEGQTCVQTGLVNIHVIIEVQYEFQVVLEAHGSSYRMVASRRTV